MSTDAPPLPGVDPPSESIRILHVDDEQSICELTEAMLEEHDSRMAITTTTDPETAVELLETEPIDCVVSDYEMPGMDGLELLEVVREQNEALPFILFTGQGSEAIASKAISAGVTEYIQKGPGTDRYVILANGIEKAVENYRHRRKAEATRRWYRSVLERSSDIVTVLGDDATIRYQSPAVEQILGYEQTALCGERLFEYIHPEDVGRVRRQFDQVCETTDVEPIDVEFRFRHADGSWRWFESIGGPTEDPIVDGIVLNSRDITDRKRREEALHRKRDRFRTLFESIPAATLRGRFESEVPIVDAVNSAFEETFGYDEVELIGKNVDEFIGLSDDAESTMRNNRELIETGSTSGYVRRKTADGVREFYLSAALRNPKADVPEGYAVYLDVTEEHQTERRLRALMEAFPDVAFIIDEAGTHLECFASEETADLLAAERSDLIGRTFHEVLPTPVADDLLSFTRQTIDSGTVGTIEYELDVRAGTRRFESRAYPIQRVETDTDAIAFVVRDITERRRRERRLKRQNDRLEEFTSIISHDLRGPLSVAAGRLELARETGKAEHFEALSAQIDRVDQMIDDLLTVARGGTIVNEGEPIDLADLTAEAWRTIEAPEASVSVQNDVTVVGDRARLRQVFENLFRNAVEHAGPAVTVTVGALEDGFYVEDDGDGIPPDRGDSVFEAGYTTTEDGTGFGLRVVSEFVDAHDWTVSITDGTDGGARFEIRGVDRP
ncbi:MAG: PAS domain S-box protein [Natronomonas sp.]